MDVKKATKGDRESYHTQVGNGGRRLESETMSKEGALKWLAEVRSAATTEFLSAARKRTVDAFMRVCHARSKARSRVPSKA